jgi:small subunit ribosomal protein S7
MPRRNRPPKREAEPDLKYNSQVVQRLINRMMHSGKKSVAQRVVYQAFDMIGERAEKLAAELLDAASNNGAAVKKREETHKMAEANRAFAHFRW